MTISTDKLKDPTMVEAPSGKDASDENFPVGSILIAPELRAHVMVYYAFARAADDIGDDETLTSEEKVRRLNALEEALLRPEEAKPGTRKALVLHATLKEREILLERGRKLLDAFRQDAVKSRYQTWEELLDYCTKSADPVGRFLLDLHGEDPAGYENSDALCTVLQILNHLQDCGKDKRKIDRVYVPTDWLHKDGLDVSIFEASQSPPALRAILDDCLDACEPLLALAKKLPPRLTDRRLAAESTVIVALAHRLAARLRKQDPLAERVALSKIDFALAALRGMWCLITHRKNSST